MNHQNADDKNTTKYETLLKTNRELATALRAMALVTQDPSPIFQLIVDCWEEIFDWLSVDDVHAFGQTCKFFHRIAGKYFEWKYKRVLIEVDNDAMYVNCRDLTGFNEFAQRISILDTEPDTSILYASANCKSSNELKIVGVQSTDLDINSLEKMLANVEVLKFHNLDISDDFMESILKLCATTLKRLTIDKSKGCDWMHHKYPKLQHFELYEINSVQELVQFFEVNPNVRSFTMVAEDILQYQKDFMASTVELDDLTILGETTVDGMSNALIELYNLGFYKRLHFTTFTKDHLEDLPGLTTLHIGINDEIDLPHLPTVTRMSFQPLWNSICSKLDMDEVTSALSNLESVLMHAECLFQCEFQSMEYLMPFIRHSKKLKEIKMEYYYADNGDIDPVLLNSEREKLNGAHMVTIYVEERDYLRIKWKYNRTDFGRIEIKRNSSYGGVLYNIFE